ncbi:MAG TPA: hypothetical protein VJK02_13715 [Anaerolineales bacterium]|nr:hypothetical protein [Anaerolineales bacterium]
MTSLLQIGLIVAGPILWFATKNRRWLIFTAIGAAWFIVDVLLITVQMSR